MGEMGSELHLVISVVVSGIGLWMMYFATSQLKSMVSVPNKRVIQINLDYRFLPFCVTLALVYVLGSTALYGIQQYQEQDFLENSNAEAKGMIGTKLLIKRLAAKDDQSCGHVRRVDGGPLMISVGDKVKPNILCGVSQSTIQKKKMVPFIQIRNEYQVMVGEWPFNYTLAYEESGIR
jgi:hypothetical protein